MLWLNKLSAKLGTADVRARTIREMGTSGDPRVLEPLLEVIQDREPKVRQAVMEALGSLGDPRVIQPLIAGLRDKQDYVRDAAALALRRVGNKAVGPLIATLENPDNAVRHMSVYALSKVGATAIPALATALKHPDAIVQESAAEALGMMNDAGAIEPLSEALQGQTDGVREMAAKGLARLGTEALPALLAALKTPQSAVRRRAVAALEKQGWKPANDSERAIQAIANGKWKEVLKLGAAAEEPVAVTLRDSVPATRQAAAAMLGDLRAASAVPALILAVDDAEINVRQAAAESLVRIGRPALDQLMPALAHESPAVRNIVALILGAIADPRAVEPLLPLLKDADAGVREAAAEALGQLRDARALAPILSLLNDSESSVRNGAVGALAKLKGPRAIGGLVTALRDADRQVRTHAAKVLGDVGNDTAAAALLAAFQADENIRLPAALALAKVAPARSVPPLVKLAVEDHAVAEEAVAALAGALHRAGADIPVDDLHLVVQLQRGSASKLAGILKTIDFGHVRDLAKAELMRRGVNILEDRQTSR